jgi:hypothetical protein
LASRSKVKTLQREVVFPQPGLSVLGLFGPHNKLVELPLEIFKVLEQGPEQLYPGDRRLGLPMNSAAVEGLTKSTNRRMQGTKQRPLFIRLHYCNIMFIMLRPSR